MPSSDSRNSDVVAVRCSYCADSAFYVRPYEGTALCKACFRKDIEEKIRRTISKYNMFRFDDHIAVGVSGGKDSLSLLTILKKVERRYPLSRMTAITVDEGIEGYRSEGMRLAQERCKELGVEHHEISFKELFGKTLDEILKANRRLAPCSYCGVLRRRALQVGARNVGASKIVTAHTLDDEAQTLLLNIFHGDVARIARVSPALSDPSRRFLPRVKPASEILERELALYAFVTGIEFQTIPCPYLASALRNDMREILNRMDAKHPGAKYMVFRSMERIHASMQQTTPEVKPQYCRQCGEPSSRDLCEVCKILSESSDSPSSTHGEVLVSS